MIDDNELESALRRYHPPDPRADLRRRVLDAASADQGPRDVPWFWGPAAAAAILLLWFGVHTSRVKPEPDPIRDAEVALISETLGGGEGAVRYAELIVPPSAPVELPW